MPPRPEQLEASIPPMIRDYIKAHREEVDKEFAKLRDDAQSNKRELRLIKNDVINIICELKAQLKEFEVRYDESTLIRGRKRGK